MARQVRVAVGQLAPAPGQPVKNAKIAAELAAAAAEMGATFILLPEMVITGYDHGRFDARPTAVPLDHPAVGILRKAAKRHKIAICAGLVEKVSEGRYINQVVALPNGKLAFQRKGCAPSQPGWLVDTERTIIKVGPLRVGIIICADSGYPVLFRKVMRQGANLICHPSAGAGWWTSEKKRPNKTKLTEDAVLNFHCLRRAQAKARELTVAYLVSNPVGRSSTIWWPGNSGIIDRDGNIRAWLPGEVYIERMRPAFVVADVTIAR